MFNNIVFLLGIALIWETTARTSVSADVDVGASADVAVGASGEVAVADIDCCKVTRFNQAFPDEKKEACLGCGNTGWGDYNGPRGNCYLLSNNNPGCKAQSCQDTSKGATDSYGDKCAWYKNRNIHIACGSYDDSDFKAKTMCCECQRDEGLVLVVNVKATDRADVSFWNTHCSKIPADAAHVKIVMGSVVDYYKPITGSTFCQMLTGYKRHQWSPDGENWEIPTYHSSPNFLGGSAYGWPKDGRKILTIWGHRGYPGHRYNMAFRNRGGCCHNSYSSIFDWRRSFDLYYEIVEEEVGDCWKDCMGKYGNENVCGKQCANAEKEVGATDLQVAGSWFGHDCGCYSQQHSVTENVNDHYCTCEHWWAHSKTATLNRCQKCCASRINGVSFQNKQNSAQVCANHFAGVRQTYLEAVPNLEASVGAATDFKAESGMVFANNVYIMYGVVGLFGLAAFLYYRGSRKHNPSDNAESSDYDKLELCLDEEL